MKKAMKSGIISMLLVCLIAATPQASMAAHGSSGVESKAPTDRIFVSVPGVKVSHLDCGGYVGYASVTVVNNTKKILSLQFSLVWKHYDGSTSADSMAFAKTFPRSPKRVVIDFPSDGIPGYNTCDLYVDKMAPFSGD